MADELPSRVVASIAFIGRSGGTVKTLAGFKKGHHTLPDAANAVTNAFLGKICETELASEAERLFQEARSGLGYKRKDIVLSVTSPSAVLTAKDFTVELTYALDEADTTRYTVVATMQELRDLDVARGEAFSRIFAGRFTEISFGLKKGVRVEAVIDAIEALDGEGGIGVVYPSDYHDCAIRVEGVDAEVRCTGASMEVVFPRGAAPAELIDAFLAVRDAFQISKVLSGLIG
ncbi:hypothetical protein [Horticoccus sp. 23ND18S-11]|uniref:hypothetical protein n=1 Tax=Horticoccus sp. 23ND18S-11 TaxID=3391832 RepID=UPI0039C938B4